MGGEPDPLVLYKAKKKKLDRFRVVLGGTSITKTIGPSAIHADCIISTADQLFKIRKIVLFVYSMVFDRKRLLCK